MLFHYSIVNLYIWHKKIDIWIFHHILNSMKFQAFTKDSHISHKISVYQQCFVGSYDKIEVWILKI